MSQMNTLLLELFRMHGVEAAAEGEWVALPGRGMKAGATVVRETPHSPALSSVQLDVRLVIASGRAIVESFVGLGATADQAAEDAFRNFTTNSFHVLLTAFFRPGDEQVQQEEWVVGGRKCPVSVGAVRTPERRGAG